MAKRVHLFSSAKMHFTTQAFKFRVNVNYSCDSLRLT